MSSAAAYDGVSECRLEDTMIPSRVHASTSMCGWTLRWLISRSAGSRSSSGARIGARSRINTTASHLRRRRASVSTSSTWSFHTVTSCAASFSKHGNVRRVSNQSSRIVTFMRRVISWTKRHSAHPKPQRDNH